MLAENGGGWSPRGEAAASQTRRTKERRTEINETTNAHGMSVQALEVEITKLKGQLQDKQRIRALESVAYFNWLGPATLTKTAEEKAKEHAERYRGVSNHKGGPPYIHAYRHLLAALTQHIDDERCRPVREDMETIVKHLQCLERAGQHEAYLSVTHCRIMTCKSEAARDKSVVSFAVSQLADDHKQVTRAILKVAVVVYGAVICQGSAPRSPIERALAEELSRLQTIHAKRTKKN